MQLQNKISLIHFNPSDNMQHVAVHNQASCTKCKEKQCLTICPTGVFKWDCLDDSPIMVEYKQCVECGACRLVCQFDNILFSYPPGGKGVIFLEG
jgi:ferredoxin like protein